MKVIDRQLAMFLEQLHFLASIHSVAVIECPLLYIHLRGSECVVLTSGLFLKWQYRQRWAVRCAIVLGFIAGPPPDICPRAGGRLRGGS